MLPSTSAIENIGPIASACADGVDRRKLALTESAGLWR